MIDRTGMQLQIRYEYEDMEGFKFSHMYCIWSGFNNGWFVLIRGTMTIMKYIFEVSLGNLINCLNKIIFTILKLQIRAWHCVITSRL